MKRFVKKTFFLSLLLLKIPAFGLQITSLLFEEETIRMPDLYFISHDIKKASFAYSGTKYYIIEDDSKLCASGCYNLFKTSSLESPKARYLYVKLVNAEANLKIKDILTNLRKEDTLSTVLTTNQSLEGFKTVTLDFYSTASGELYLMTEKQRKLNTSWPLFKKLLLKNIPTCSAQRENLSNQLHTINFQRALFVLNSKAIIVLGTDEEDKHAYYLIQLSGNMNFIDLTE